MISFAPAYLVSSEGRVFSARYGRLIGGGPLGLGGHKKLYLGKDFPNVNSHRLVFSEFVRTLNGRREVVRHINHDPSDNRLCNLTVGTQLDNVMDAKSRGTFDKRGSKNMSAKLTERSVATMRELYADGGGQSDIAQLFGVSVNTVHHVCARKTWKHVP